MVNWESIVTILEKIGLLVVVLFLAYVVLRVLVGLLVDLFMESSTGTQEITDQSTDAEVPGGDPVDDVPGLHVLSDYGSRHGLIDRNPTETTIRTTIRDLDWVAGFHQVILVTSPGISLEVGGSLDPDDGLAAVYRDSRNNIFDCPSEPPTTIQTMEDLLVSFLSGDGRWKRMLDFEQIPSSVT